VGSIPNCAPRVSDPALEALTCSALSSSLALRQLLSAGALTLWSKLGGELGAEWLSREIGTEMGD